MEEGSGFRTSITTDNVFPPCRGCFEILGVECRILEFEIHREELGIWESSFSEILVRAFRRFFQGPITSPLLQGGCILKVVISGRVYISGCGSEFQEIGASIQGQSPVPLSGIGYIQKRSYFQARFVTFPTLSHQIGDPPQNNDRS